MKVKFTGELEIDPKDLIGLIPSIPPTLPPDLSIPPAPIENPDIPNPSNPIHDVIDWSQGKILLESGRTYYLTEYETYRLTQNIYIETTGKERASIVCGIPGYSQYLHGESRTQPRFLWDLGNGEFSIFSKNVNYYNAQLVDEVHPFQRALFTNNPNATNQKSYVALIDCDTDMQLGLFYSGQQELQQVIYYENLTFKGMMWIETKAEHGGGLLIYGVNSKLTQVDPRSSFISNFRFTQNEVFSSLPFTYIDSTFDGFGNSSNIIYCHGMVFQLRPGLGKESSVIARIPKAGDKFSFYFDGTFLSSPEVQLQAGDKLLVEGREVTVIARDRVPLAAYAERSYPQDYKISGNIPLIAGKNYLVQVIHSYGAALLDGREYEGYMIFKYNKHFYTSITEDLGLDYILESNPYGVLFYNHRQISMIQKGVIADGFYRQSQSKSNFGHSHGYWLENCVGFGDQYNPGEYRQIMPPIPESFSKWLSDCLNSS